MKPYDDKTPCVKCGATDATTTFQDWTPVCGVQVIPLMRRDCRRCSYVWYELPLDAPPLEEYFDNKVRDKGAA